jgi:RNA polymerase sigma factor (sigma-70 family)
MDERMRISLEAAIMNQDLVFSARDPNAMIYTLAWRALNKIYREEFVDGVPRGRQFKPAEGEQFGTGEYELGLSQVRQAGKPTYYSKTISDRRNEEFNEQFERARTELPFALEELGPTERQVLKLYYGYNSDSMKMTQIADLIEEPLRTAYWILSEALKKLRAALCPPDPKINIPVALQNSPSVAHYR